MYTPDIFVEEDDRAVAEMIDRARLGLLVTHGPEGLFATHLPFLRDPDTGVLTGHIARANPHPRMAGDGEAMVIFSVSDAYVTPSWYPSKAIHGREVPTWNYEAVHVHGRLRWFSEPERLRDLLQRLAERHEAGRPEPWSLSDAPEDYITPMLRGIVGVELTVSRIEAKRKLSQNRNQADREAVAAGLNSSLDARDREVAAQMRKLEPPA